MATKKPSKKAEADRLATLGESCASAIRLIAEGRNSVTDILARQCQSESDVIFALTRMAEGVKLEDKALQPYLTRTYQNSATQYVTRCRTGEVKIPAVWFDPTRTISFANEFPEFAPYRARKIDRTKAEADKAKAEAELNKLAEAKAEALLNDKAELTKVQTAKVAKAEAEAKAKAEKAEKAKAEALALAKGNKAEADQSKRDLAEAKAKIAELDKALAHATRQVAVLTKALQALKIEDDAIQAILRQAN